MADEINENHHHDGEDVGGGEGGNEKGERGEERGFQINDDDARKQIGVEGRGLEAAKRLLDLLGPEAGGCAECLVHEDLLPNEKHGEKKRAHGENAEREEEENAGEFADEVFVARDRLGENGVNGAVFEVAREELSGGDDREERAEDAHRA